MSDDPRELEVGMVVKIVAGAIQPHVDGDVGIVAQRPSAPGAGGWVKVLYRGTRAGYYYRRELEILSHE